MVDDSEFVKRRHLSRGRPRKYEPSSSPNSNSQPFGNNAIATTASSDAVDGGSAVNESIATTSPDLSTAGFSSRQRSASSSSNLYNRSGNKTNGSEKNGGNDDYDICEVSQRSPAGCQSYINSGRKHYCGSKQRPHLQGPLIGVAIKTNVNSLIDHNRISNRSNIGSGVVVIGNDPGVSGIDDIGSVGSLDVDSQNVALNISNTGMEAEDTRSYDFHTQGISNDAVLNSSTGSKSNSGRYSPTLQNMWSYGSSLSDEVTSAEFACINNDRYRNFVSGLHLQSVTQRHHFQHKSGSHRMHLKTQQQQQDALRNNISNQQHDVRSLHQTHGYHIYHTNPDDQNQKMLLDQHNQLIGPDIFSVNVIPSNSEKYFSHNIECRNDDETFNLRHQDHLNIRSHQQKSRSDISTDEISTNHLYIHHHNGHGIDVKYTPPHKSLYSFETHNLNKSDVSFNNKRSAEEIYLNKSSDAAEEDSGIVDCDREEIQRKRKKDLDYDNVEIKAEEDSEPELRNIGIPLRTKSY